MRIAFLTSEFVSESNLSGGLSNYLYRTCLTLKKLDHDPVILVTSSKKETLFLDGIEIHRVTVHPKFFIKILNKVTLNRFARPFSVVSSALAFSKKIQQVHSKKHIDIIQAASYWGTGLFISKELPCIVRISSFEPLWRLAYEKPLTFAQKIFEWLELIPLKKADGVYAPSMLLAKEIEKKINKKVKILESPFTMDTQKLDSSVYKKHLKGKKYLLFFGTIGLMKGCKIIGDIIGPLLEKYPNLFFTFIGPVKEYKNTTMIDYIKKRAGSNKDKIIYLEPLPHQAIYPIISNSSGVILPSTVDNLPNSCIEAMYLGKIVVGSKGASFEQLIQDGKSGFLCSLYDPDSLFKAIERLLALSGKEKKAISKMAKERVRILSPHITGKALINYYQKIISLHH